MRNEPRISWKPCGPHPRPISPEETIEQQLVDFGWREQADGRSVRLPAHPAFVRREPPSGVQTTLVWGWAKYHRSGSEEWFVALEELA